MERSRDGIIEGKLEEELRIEAMVVYSEVIKRPEIIEAFAILDRLSKEDFHYHNRAHTEDVILEAVLFAIADGADMETIEQQAIAAAWHDVGFVEQYQKNEPIAVKLFKESEAYKTLSEGERDEVIANILDTQIVVEGGAPSFLHERSSKRYILDADVGNFGRKDFFDNRKKIADELKVDLRKSNESGIKAPGLPPLFKKTAGWVLLVLIGAALFYGVNRFLNPAENSSLIKIIPKSASAFVIIDQKSLFDQILPFHQEFLEQSSFYQWSTKE